MYALCVFTLYSTLAVIKQAVWIDFRQETPAFIKQARSPGRADKCNTILL